MEVKRENAAMLSNFEVLSLLNDMQRGKGKWKLMHTNLATISYEIAQYLESAACSKQSPEVIDNILKALDHYKLTKAEKLQLLNLCLKTAVEIQLIVEESEERLNEEHIYSLLNLIVKHLPGNAEQEMEEPEERG